MSKSEKEMKQEFEAEYKVEPHSDAYNKCMSVLDEALSIKPSGKTKQIGGNHYAKHTIQPWVIIDDWCLDYYLGNVIKYVLRDKNDKVEDLHKAIHYLEKKIELLEAK